MGADGIDLYEPQSLSNLEDVGESIRFFLETCKPSNLEVKQLTPEEAVGRGMTGLTYGIYIQESTPIDY